MILSRLNLVCCVFGVLACYVSEKPQRESIGVDGGSITVPNTSIFGGAHLVIPAGALSERTTIGLAMGRDLVEGSEEPLGSSVAVTPTGLALWVPAQLTLPLYAGELPAEGHIAVVASVSASADRVFIPDAELAINDDTGTVSVSISRLGTYQVIHVPR